MPLFALLVAAFFASEAAFACKCLAPSTAAQAWQDSEAVFSGRVLKIQKKKAAERYHTEVELEVLEPWKGVSGSRMKVTTGQGGGDCGYPFKVGGRYLVFAYGKDDLKVDTCTRTSELETAKVDPKLAKVKVLRDVAASSSKNKLTPLFHEKEVGPILQMILDDARLDPYFKIDVKPERKPLVVLENQFTKKTEKLQKFGAPVVLVDRKKTTTETPLFDFSEVRFEQSRAHVRFFYSPENLKGEVDLEKGDEGWKILDYRLASQ